MEDFKKITLKNGMTLYYLHDSLMKSEYFDFVIKYGLDGKWFNFNYDGVDYHVLPGCAHFLEHMLGEHSKHGNIYSNFGNRGYLKNGSTSTEYTHYFFSGTKEIKESIKELIEAVELPIFTEEDVRDTSHAIEVESTMVKDRLASTKTSILFRNAYSKFEKVSDTLCMIGDVETTRKLDYKTLKLCYDAFYHDGNKVLVYAGNRSEEEIVSYIESIYENIPRHENKLKTIDVDYTGIRKEYDEYVMNVSEDLHSVLFKCYNNNDYSRKEMEYFLQFTTYSKFSTSSNLQISLFAKDLVNSIYAYGYNILDGVISFNISVYSNNFDKYIEEVKEKLLEPMSEDEFNTIKKVYIADHARRYDNKFEELVNFSYRLFYTDYFQDIEYIKGLSYDRYLEFINSLKINEQTRAKIRNK